VSHKKTPCRVVHDTNQQMEVLQRTLSPQGSSPADQRKRGAEQRMLVWCPRGIPERSAPTGKPRLGENRGKKYEKENQAIPLHTIQRHYSLGERRKTTQRKL
ncbi:unnamed protein product, partial [Ectocarpus sp. 12 AP-2014]